MAQERGDEAPQDRVHGGDVLDVPVGRVVHAVEADAPVVEEDGSDRQGLDSLG